MHHHLAKIYNRPEVEADLVSVVNLGPGLSARLILPEQLGLAATRSPRHLHLSQHCRIIRVCHRAVILLLIPYCRVSTARHGKPGNPGLEAQRKKFLNLADAIKAATVDQLFIEIEANAETRPELNKAVKMACELDAIVVVAKLYPLARDADFLEKLAKLDREKKSFKGFLFADIPRCQWPNHTALIADLAQFEKQAPGKPIREALAVSKDSGKKLGGTRPETNRENVRKRDEAHEKSEELRPLLAPMHAEGASLRTMAQALADKGFRTRNGNRMSASQIKRHLERLDLLETLYQSQLFYEIDRA
jgi:DNA invertase Pin-like site-specific DNA recombinase